MASRRTRNRPRGDPLRGRGGGRRGKHRRRRRGAPQAYAAIVAVLLAGVAIESYFIAAALGGTLRPSQRATLASRVVPVRSVLVPDVLDRTFPSAAAAARARGFLVRESVGPAPGPAGVVLAQSPAGGHVGPRGSVVVLAVSGRSVHGSTLRPAPPRSSLPAGDPSPTRAVVSPTTASSPTTTPSTARRPSTTSTTAVPATTGSTTSGGSTTTTSTSPTTTPPTTTAPGPTTTTTSGQPPPPR